MNTTIIIVAIAAIILAVAAYYLGKAAGWKEGCMEKKDTTTLPSMPNAIKIPKHYLTRYVLMDKKDIHSTNDAIEALEDEGFTVDDYDTDDGIITMTKGVYENEEKESENPEP